MAIAAAHFIIGPTYFATTAAVGWSAVLAVTLAACASKSPDACRPQVLVVCLFFGLFVFVRFAQLVVAPSSSVTFTLPPYNGQALESALVYVTFGMLALLGGILIGPKPPMRKSRTSQRTSRRAFLAGLIVVWLLGFGAAAIVTWHDATVFVTGESRGSPIGWLVRLLDPDAILLIAVVWIVRERGLPWRYVAIITAFIAVWIVVTVLSGSRSAMVRIGLLVFFAFLAVRPHAEFKIGRARWAVPAFVALAIAIALAGQIARYWQVGVNNPADLALDEAGADAQAAAILAIKRDREGWADWAVIMRLQLEGEREELRIREAQSDHAAVKSVKARIAQTENDLDAAEARAETHFVDTRVHTACSGALCRAYYPLVPILERLGAGIDYAVYTLEGKPRPKVVDTYIRSPYALKRIVNAAVPGTIFQGYDVSTPQVFAMAFRGFDEERVRKNYMAEPWTLWGYCKIVFGPWWGLVVIFLAGALLQTGYAALAWIPEDLRDYARTAYLFLVTWRVVDFFGPDHFVMTIIHYGTALTFSLLAILGGQFFVTRLTAAKPLPER